MDGFSGEEIWRSIPPEEKFEIMAQAQAAGVLALMMFLILAGTMAVGLKLPWVMWTGLLGSPFVYQFAAGKKWRDVRPRAMLEYLGARSAARRFAFAARGKDLSCNFLFKGKVERVFNESDVHEALEAMIDNVKEAQVWIALFGDSVVMMEEKLGGAESRFARIIDEHLAIESRALDGRGEYSAHKEILLTISYRNREPEIFKVTSRYPAALIVFEKKLQQLLDGPRAPSQGALAVNDAFGDNSSSGLMIFD